MVERLRVLVLGGYGTFGGRLASLLADDARLHLIVAGRSLERARAFCEGLPPGAGREPAHFDRDADVRAQMAMLRPDIVVDATGPFQAYGADPYRVVEACLAEGVNYLDLADGSDFAAGISAFDVAARDAGIYVLTGVSSFPVLTAAVVRHLARDMARVTHVSGGIAPSPYAGVGLNVIRAIAGYAGKPVPRLQDGHLGWGYPWTDTRRRTIRPPGFLPLRSRVFSLVDVPDLRAIPQLWPALKSAWMGAAPVPESLHRGLRLLAWLVRLRLLPSLRPLAPLFFRATNTLRWGEHRGGMFVDVKGKDAMGKRMTRSWHLLAEGDDGPLIPSMAAVAVIRRVLAGRAPEPGARVATRSLELDDYAALFAGRRIHTGTRDEQAEREMPLYRRILGDAWARLPPSLRQMHGWSGDRFAASGEAIVERGRGVLARVAANIMRFPKAGERVPVRVEFVETGRGETWTRRFAGSRFSSVQLPGSGKHDGLITERFGMLSVALAAVLDGERLRLIVRDWSMLGIPMPRCLAPSGEAFECEQDGRFHFDVELKAPLLGRLVRYRGWLAPEN